MDLTLTIFLISFVCTTVYSVAAKSHPFEVSLSRLDVVTSFNDPIELFNSLFNLVSFIIPSVGHAAEDELSVIRSTFTDINNINHKLNDISRNLQGFREEVTSKLEQLKLGTVLVSRLDDFFKFGEKIDLYYSRFKKVSKGRYSRTALNDLIQAVKPLRGGVRTILTEMHNTLSLNRWSSSAFNVMSDNTIVSSLICSRGSSQQLIIHNFFKALCAAEIKGLTMDLFAIKEQIKNKQEIMWEVNNAQEAFVQRSNQVLPAVKKAMSKASRQFWNCRSNDPQEGVTFEKFDSFIFQSFEPEQGLTDPRRPYKPYNLCKRNCRSFITRSLCTSRDFNEDCNKFSHTCPGNLRGCKSFDSKISICNAPSGSQRRYEYAEGDNGKFFGKDKGSCSGDIINFSSYYSFIYVCQVCLCTCENTDLYLDIYVNLREVLSDGNQNKAIVGIRLKKVGGIFLFSDAASCTLTIGLSRYKNKIMGKSRQL